MDLEKILVHEHEQFIKNNREQLTLDFINSKLVFINKAEMEKINSGDMTLVCKESQTSKFILLRSFKTYFLSVLDEDVK